MSLFPEWEQAHQPEAVLPERIKHMRAVYGKRDEHTCKHCIHLRRYEQGTRWMKCDMSRQTGGTGTDWKASFPACGLYRDEQE